MVYELVACKHCGATEPVKRHGKTAAGKPRYRCYGCGKTFLRQYTNRGHEQAVRQQITDMAINGSGMRETARVLRISRSTVTAHLKKKLI